jgi:general secretion pathway protein A
MSENDQLVISRASRLLAQGKSLCIYGEPGTGKSMLLKALIAQLDSRTYKVALVPYGNIKRSILLRELCDELEIDATGRGSLIGRLRKHFVSGGDAPFPVIIVDDAHELEKESFFDLCSLLHDSKKRTAAASLILCGHGCLKKMLALDIYAAISTRMAAQFKMNSLSPSDSIAFIKHRLSIAQANENIFSNDAMELIAADGNGNRRSLMNLCSMAMEVACERHERVISADLVHNMHMEGV